MKSPRRQLPDRHRSRLDRAGAPPCFLVCPLYLGSMFTAADLFDLAQTSHAAIFDGCDAAWEALPKISQYIKEHLRPGLHNTAEGDVFIGPDVFIGEGTVVEHGAMI